MARSIFGPGVKLSGARFGDLTTGEFYEDFKTGFYTSTQGGKFATAADKGEWLVTALAGGSNPTIQDDVDGGAVRFNSDGDAGDQMNIQLNGQSFQIAANKRFHFSTKLSFDNTTLDAVVGVSVNATDAHASAPANAVYFRLDGDGNWDTVTTSNSTSTTSTAVGTLTAATATDLTFDYNPATGSVYFYIDGVEVAQHNTNIPTGTLMSPIVTVESNGAEEPCEWHGVYIHPDA